MLNHAHKDQFKAEYNKCYTVYSTVFRRKGRFELITLELIEPYGRKRIQEDIEGRWSSSSGCTGAGNNTADREL